MVALGVDWGRVRVGVAVSDELGLLAHPAALFEGKSLRECVEGLKVLALQHRASILVLGLPLNMDGTEGESAADVRRFGKHVGQVLELPVEFWDERLTTWQADRFLVGRSPRKKKAVRDQMAACLILQGYLDAQKNRRAHDPA
jgi:putative Holliday junction resolvase